MRDSAKTKQQLMKELTELRQQVAELKSEEALQESERRYRLLAENVTDVLWTMDMDMRFTYISPSVTHQRGYTVEEAMALGAEGTLTPESLDAATKLMVRALSEDAEHRDPSRSWTVELELYRKDGKTIWTEMTVTFLRGSGGQPVGILGVARDITERKKAKEALQESEERYHAVFDEAGDGIALTDFDTGQFYDCNPEFERQTGRKLEDLKKMKMWEARPPDKAELAKARFSEIKEKEAGSFSDLPFVKPDGEVVQVEAKARVVSIGGKRYVQGMTRDITERLRAEQALRESEQRFRIASQMASDLVYERDLRTGMATFYGDVDARMGYEPGEFPRTADAWSELVHPDDLARAIQSLGSQLQIGDRASSEYRLRRGDGTFMRFFDRFMVVADERTGEPAKIIGVASDVTELRRVEEELRRSEEYFRALTENAQDGIVVVDKDGAAQYLSPSVERVAGRRVEARVGRGAFDNVHPEDMGLVVGAFAEITQSPGAVAHVEVRAGAADGQWRVLEVLANNLLDNPAVKGIVVNFRDITERKRAEQALRESEEHYSALVANLTDAVFTFRRGVVVWCNDRVEEIYGYSKEELLGKPATFFYPKEMSPKDYVKAVSAAIKARGLFRGTDRFQRRDGSIVNIEYSLSQMHGRDPIEVIAVARDVTDRVKAEVAVKEYSVRLEQMVEERTRELKEAQDELVRRERLAVLGQLAGGVGHDLRNPLGAIKNAAYFLNMVLEKPEPEVKETLQIVNREVATCERIISSLLDFARQKPPSLRKVSVNDVVKEALSHTTVPDNVKLVTQLNEHLPQTMADSSQLVQVLGNILLNAVQAMPRGGSLVVRSEVPTPGWVAVAVTDTGVGIPAENLPRLFEPLFTTKPKGIGLGLAVSRLLVEAHGGSLEVQSEVGKGSTFAVRLPVGP